MSKKEKLEFDLDKFVNNNSLLNLTFLGLTGSGKTFAIRKIITKIQQNKKRNVITCDTKHEFSDMKDFQATDLEKKGIIRKVRKVKVGNKIYENPHQIMEFCSSVGWEWTPSIVYIEEIADCITSKQKSLPESCNNTYKILQQGRSKNCNLICSTQKISQLHEAFLDEATYIFIFAVSLSESAKLEDKLKLPKGSLSFDLPDLDEIPFEELQKDPSKWKDLYSFCVINQMRQVKWYYPFDFNTKIKTSKNKFSLKEVKETT